MDKNRAKAQVKAGLEEYLRQKGIDTTKPFRCLNPAHEDKNPSMSLDRKRNKCHCFACGKDYDTFDLIAMDYGLTQGKDIFLKAYEIFRLPQDAPSLKGPRPKPAPPQDLAKAERSEHDFTAYFEQCQGRIGQTDYWRRRGLIPQVVERFRIGFDPRYGRGTAGQTWQALIIPTGEGSFVARNTALTADARQRYRKTGPSRVFNASALQQAQMPIVIVEGELDALAVLSAGGEAVALGSTANVRSFLRISEAEKPRQPLILALDNDAQGRKAEDELAEGLREQGISPYRLNLYGDCKDAGEAIVQDRDSFVAAIESAMGLEEQARQTERQLYLQTNTASHLQQFIDGIGESVNTPCVSTGFQKLDDALDRGLYEGLYVIGAISSLGKTTLITQMGDQIAQAGNDVLIFSLEMARSQLMAKSISRHTLLTAREKDLDTRNAKTARGITDGRRYLNYSRTEQSLIQEAIRAYGAYAGRIYISEGIGDIGVEQVRQTVEKHLAFTGRRPVVIIDYLQILSPYSDRATDKQNTDKAVLELKRISRDHKLPLLAISSFNRANYKEAVTMEAFKESGAVEYSSDVLLGLQLQGAGKKDFDSTEEKRKDPRQIELVILKNRDGKVGERVAFEYYPYFNYFKEI